ncbi:pyridoxamine 5'-phosphate oxidase family protein [Roseivirga sp. BDSF3-8]|uniref:pyridoxamine 5'-phosphate oxidase family protein n=1 Tax=Roseivirga sp. BDSF3-8 TaxID=3241598 RepID=UPI0035320D96
MKKDIPSLSGVFTDTWATLRRGSADPKHGFHWPVIASVGIDGPEQRKVVLRKVDKEEASLICYTDHRSPKLAQLLEDNRTSWLFYDRNTKTQVRASGISVIHHKNEKARRIWKDIEPSNRQDYTGPLAPGTPLDEYQPNLATPFTTGNPTRDNTAFGIENFVIIETALLKIDYLKLEKDGHIRALFFRQKGEKEWHKSWIAP